MKNLIRTPLLYLAWVMPETDFLAPPNHKSQEIKQIKAKYLLISVFLLILTSCTGLSEYDNQQVQSAMNDSLLVTTESWDVEMELHQGGEKRIAIEGSHAVNYQSEENKHTNIAGPIYVQIFDSTGAVESEAWSKRAVYLETEAEFELYDSVRVETHDNTRLFSEYLKWTQETDRISSPNFVIIITTQDSLSGTGFEGLTDLSDYEIIEPRGNFIIN